MAELETNLATETETTVSTATNETDSQNANTTEAPEVAKLRSEIAKLKSATDKATKEAADYKRQLRARQSAEEAKAEEEQERQTAIEKELNELRKERAVANTSRKVFTFIQDEAASTSIAEALYGAEDVDLAIDAIHKAWTAKEKALRLEFGKIPAPGIGNSDGPTITADQLKSMGYKERLEFASQHPDEYNKLMGR